MGQSAGASSRWPSISLAGCAGWACEPAANRPEGSSTSRPTTGWALTDGKAGDEQPCLAVAEALGLSIETRRVRPRAAFALLMPYGPADPAEASGRAGSPIAPPFPDIAVASGRRALPYLRAVKRLSGGRTFTVFLKDPRTGPGSADLIWAPEHDGLRGSNVVVTLTGPHGVSAERLAAARRKPDPRIAALSAPRVAILVGGDSRHHRFTPADMSRLVESLASIASTGVALAITGSRRTPPSLQTRLRDLASATGGFLWDGSEPNPYLSILACAQAIVVTADSINMVGEACATGAPVHVFEPSGGHRKIRACLHALSRHGAVRPFRGRLEGFAYAPLDATPEIAQAILHAFGRHRSAIRT